MWVLRTHGAHALLHICNRARVGKQKVLDPSTKAPRAPVRAPGLVQLDHAAHVREEVDRSPQRVQGEQVVRRVFCDKLDIVVLPSVLQALSSQKQSGQTAAEQEVLHTRWGRKLVYKCAYPSQFDNRRPRRSDVRAETALPSIESVPQRVWPHRWSLDRPDNQPDSETAWVM